MNKTLIAASVAMTLGSGVANAAFLLPGSTGTIDLTSGCFTFGDCAIDGIGPDDITDNALTVSGFGTGVAGDGLVGSIGFTVGADGNSLTITSFQQDSYTNTSGGTFALDFSSLAGMSANISDAGDVTIDTTGRTGIAQFFVATIGLQPWNIDDSLNISGQGDATSGAYELWTSGTDNNWSPGAPGTPAATVSGSALTAAGPGSWTGTIVSAGNVGDRKSVV